MVFKVIKFLQATGYVFPGSPQPQRTWGSFGQQQQASMNQQGGGGGAMTGFADGMNQHGIAQQPAQLWAPPMPQMHDSEGRELAGFPGY